MDYQEYPRVMYHDDGRTIHAISSDHEGALGGDGWRREPSPAHVAANASRHPSVVAPVDASGQDGFIDKLIARIREEFFSDGDDGAPAERRGPGRPRKQHHPKPTTQARAGSRTASNAEGDE